MIEDIPLSHEERKEKIGLIRGIKFESLKIDDHNLNKYGKPRHGLTTEKIKEIYNQFDKIKDVFKRPSKEGFRYCFLYKLNKNQNYYIVIMLDERPVRLFNAYPSGRNIEKRLFRKYFGAFNRR